MKLLLDTHALLWWLDGDKQLPKSVRILVENEQNNVLVSAASAWEIATKVRIGKLPGAIEIAEQFMSIVREQNFEFLSISVEHARHAGLFPGDHRDPFDRMLIAQAHLESCALVSNEKLFDQFGIRRIW